jgi:hypothetical protein
MHRCNITTLSLKEDLSQGQMINHFTVSLVHPQALALAPLSRKEDHMQATATTTTTAATATTTTAATHDNNSRSNSGSRNGSNSRSGSNTRGGSESVSDSDSGGEIRNAASTAREYGYEVIMRGQGVGARRIHTVTRCNATATSAPVVGLLLTIVDDFALPDQQPRWAEVAVF